MQLVDYDVLRELAAVGADSGSAFMLELMNGFAADARAALERMRGCARLGECAALAREAHRLKGSSATVGAVALSAACLEMERRARAGSCEGIEAGIERALRLLDASGGCINAFFRGNIAAAA